MKRWVTGDQAEMDQDDIDRELFELAREWMEVSKLKKLPGKKLPGHVAKETDVSLWKQFRDWTKKKGAVRVRSFRCPLKHRTGCNAGIRIQYGPDWMQLDRCGEHNANSHDHDKSKYLKYDQIVAISDAVTIAPQMSAAQLRRNMQLADSPGKKIAPEFLRSVQHYVKLSRAQLTMKQLDGFDINSSYGSLQQFSDKFWFADLFARNNDGEDEFHFDLFTPVVIGRNLDAPRDIVHINLTSLWFLFNLLRVIASGWVFQLNGDATFSFCRVAVDMIGLGVNSVGNHNHPVCWSIIPHNTEGELTYTGTFIEMQDAFLLLKDIKPCGKLDCEFCNCYKMLMQNENVIKYFAGDDFKERRIPVDTAQCDQIQGWGNFTREILGIDPNTCSVHLTGTYLSFVHMVMSLTTAAFRHPGVELFSRVLLPVA
jgi:hypothetical protein